MAEEKYFSRSWALLTRDKGWIKPILLMTAASLVPIVGFLGVQGYALEWARLTAWGVDSSPKQKNVDVGGCITSGARAFVVSLGLGLAVSVVTGIVTLVFSAFPGAVGMLLGSIVSLATTLVTIVATMFILACQLRCAIYEQIGAGYRVDRVFVMVKRDTNGFARLVLLSFLCGLVVSAVVFVFVLILAVGVAPVVMMAARSGSSAAVTNAVLAAIVPIVFIIALLVLVCDFLGNGILLIEVTATALWFRKFDVTSWGKSEDPLPETGPGASAPSVNVAAPTGMNDRPSARPYEAPQTQQPEQRVLEAKPTEAQPQDSAAPLEPPLEPQSSGQSAPEDSAKEEPTEEAPSQGPAEGVKDVDSLYADLYDVIQRDNHENDE